MASLALHYVGALGGVTILVQTTCIAATIGLHPPLVIYMNRAANVGNALAFSTQIALNFLWAAVDSLSSPVHNINAEFVHWHQHCQHPEVASQAV